MPKSSIAHDPYLYRDTLTIAEIICFASGKRDWPPTDEFWLGIQADLKHACDCGEIRFSSHADYRSRALYYISLLDLREFLVKKDQRWKPLRDFCRRWADARGDTQSLGADEQADSGSRTVAKKTETEQRDKEIYALFKAISADNPKAKQGRIFDMMKVKQADLFTNRRETIRVKEISNQRVARIIRAQQGQ